MRSPRLFMLSAATGAALALSGALLAAPAGAAQTLDAVDDSYTVTKDQILDVPARGVLSNDTPATAGDVLTASPATPAAGHGTITLRADGSFRYVPNAGYTGPDTFTYTANEGDMRDTAQVFLTVNAPATTPPATTTTTPPPPGGTTPVARDDNYTTPVNKNLVIGGPGVLGNDSDADGDPLSAALIAGAGHGTVNVAGNGAFTYVPTTNYTGPDQFTYKACDPGGKCDPATVFITVGGTVTAPPPGVGRPIYQTCAAAFAAGVANIPSTDARYRPQLDKDHDGIACELNGDDGVKPNRPIVVPGPQGPAGPQGPQGPAGPSATGNGPTNVIVVPPAPAQTFTSPQAPSSGAVATGDGSLAGTA